MWDQTRRQLKQEVCRSSAVITDLNLGNNTQVYINFHTVQKLIETSEYRDKREKTKVIAKPCEHAGLIHH